ncbi:MAG: arsenic resistance protein, partial [Burkholderiaceae bacterium]
VVAFAPIAAFLLGVTNLTVPWETLLVSVVFYVVLPLLAGVYTRSRLASNPQALTALMARLKPLSMLGLVATVAILFGFQAETMLANPLPMVLIAIPLILQSYGVFAVAWIMAKRLRLSHAVAGPACLIGTSNFFELAVAVAISLFGLNSGAALATVVGVLVEVPVMLSLVHWVNHRRQATETA